MDFNRLVNETTQIEAKPFTGFASICMYFTKVQKRLWKCVPAFTPSAQTPPDSAFSRTQCRTL